MGVDVGRIPPGDSATVVITIHGEVQEDDGETFSNAVNAAIKTLRDLGVQVDVNSESVTRVAVSGYTLDARTLETLTISLRAALRKTGSRARIEVTRVDK